jgi:hypothetical protein
MSMVFSDSTTLTNEQLAVMKRANKTFREAELLDEPPVVHPLIEKVARAISDWQSERDWLFHTDQAIRVIETIAEQLGKEGYDMPQDYLRRAIWKEEPKPRQEEQRCSTLYF